jgi:hypothetical protein
MREQNSFTSNSNNDCSEDDEDDDTESGLYILEKIGET